MNKNTTKQFQVIFGGTFDPFHTGHLTVAKHVANHLAVKEITLLPANIPPHKSAAKVTKAHRLAMLTALTNQEPLLKIDDRELNRDKPSYTIDTLRELKAASPQTAINFVIGMDSLLSFTTWYQWQDIINLANLIVCTRPNYQLDETYEGLDKQLHQFITEHACFDLTAKHQITILPAIAADISSSQIRHELKNNLASTNSLLPDVINQYIGKHNLYNK